MRRTVSSHSREALASSARANLATATGSEAKASHEQAAGLRGRRVAAGGPESATARAGSLAQGASRLWEARTQAIPITLLRDPQSTAAPRAERNLPTAARGAAEGRLEINLQDLLPYVAIALPPAREARMQTRLLVDTGDQELCFSTQSTGGTRYRSLAERQAAQALWERNWVPEALATGFVPVTVYRDGSGSAAASKESFTVYMNGAFHLRVGPSAPPLPEGAALAVRLQLVEPDESASAPPTSPAPAAPKEKR